MWGDMDESSSGWFKRIVYIKFGKIFAGKYHHY